VKKPADEHRSHDEHEGHTHEDAKSPHNHTAEEGRIMSETEEEHMGHAGHSHQGVASPLSCASGGGVSDYNVSLQVGGIFIVIFVTMFGIMLPMMGRYSNRFKIPPYGLLLMRAFGTGVVLSTGFIHMLHHAAANLNHPCIPESIRETEGMAGIIALLAVFAIHLLQTVATSRLKKSAEAQGMDVKLDRTDVPMDQRFSRYSFVNQLDVPLDIESSGNPVRSSHVAGGASSHAHNHSHGDSHSHSHAPSKKGHGDEDHNCATEGIARLEATKNRLTAYMLEIGMVSHSVIVGVTIALAEGQTLVSLLIAMCFHQFFEALGIGSILMDSGFKKMKTPLIMAAAFIMATPLGQVIGIAVAMTSHGNTSSSHMVQGIFESLSAGILIYDGLVNVLNLLITQSTTFYQMTLKRQIGMFAALYMGYLAMLMVGLFEGGVPGSGGHHQH
jgi:zinc transporter 1/2/3